MQTAEQHNAPLVGKVETLPSLTADEIRSKLVEQFEQFKPHLTGYHEYAERCIALSLEYHAARFKEECPDLALEEMTLVASFDARETPKSLDAKLAQLKGTEIRRLVFDRAKATYFLFV
jgi:hypothetical protein